MNKKHLILSFISLAIIVFIVCLVYWIADGRIRDLTIENPYTQCLLKPFSGKPREIPLRKSYDENFRRKVYHYFPGWWKPQLSSGQKLKMPKSSIVYLLKDEENFWFSSIEGEFYRYDTQAKVFKTYTLLDETQKPISFFDLAQTKDGDIWATVSIYNPGKGYSALALYQPETDSFNVILDKGGLFKLTDRSWSGPGKRIDELANGQLIVILDKKIYTYDPKTNEARELHTNGKVENFIVDKQDRIWFVNSSPDNSVYRIDPTTGQVSNFGEPPQLTGLIGQESELESDIKKINIDHQGRIWVSYFDRLELDGNGIYHWKSLDLPTVMVVTFDPSYAYNWANTRSSLISSIGDIWFTTNEGIAKYEMQTGTWCLSAVTRDNGSPAIIEDTEGNIWTIDRRQIYKFNNRP